MPTKYTIPKRMIRTHNIFKGTTKKVGFDSEAIIHTRRMEKVFFHYFPAHSNSFIGKLPTTQLAELRTTERNETVISH